MNAALALAYAVLGLILVVNLAHLFRRRGLAARDIELPSISILVPARNEAHNLPTLFDSVLIQRYPTFDLHVYDDGSEDGTWALLAAVDDCRLRPVRGEGLPSGWVGKVHALYQLSRRAEGDVLLFLDADARLADPDALERLVRRFLALPKLAVLTGIPRLEGGGGALVSLIPFTLLTQLPLPLIGLVRAKTLSAVNGQCWMIRRSVYSEHEPHRAHPGEVLEDVHIGRYLKGRGVSPYIENLQGEVVVRMYGSLREAWRGFRKNAYLIMGGTVPTFLVSYTLFVAVFCLAPLTSTWFLGALYGLKAISDRWSGFPLTTTLIAPLSFLMTAVLQLDSAISHWLNRVRWKERSVSRSSLSGRAAPPL